MICRCAGLFLAGLLVGRGQPGHVRVDKEEEHDDDSHEIHIDEQKDATVIETPAFLHAADRVGGADESDQQGKDEEWSGMVAGEVGESEGSCQAEQHERVAAKQRVGVRIEDGESHGDAILLGKYLVVAAL